MHARLRSFDRARRAPAILIAIGVLAVLTWHVSARRRAPVGVVLVTLDTTRADRLSAYGFMDAAMPALDRLAREGVVFDQATTVAPLTLPAHASLLTGLLPPRLGVRDNADTALAATHTTLAEILHARGFRTGAFVASAVLDPERGLAQGFDVYKGAVASRPTMTEARQRRADDVTTDALQWLEQVAGSRFFLWTHLYDPHAPYDPPEPFRSRHADPYVGEIAFADSQIGRLLDELARRQLLERTVVVVASDHGEGLGEHGERDHGIFVYETVLRVPLMIRVPRGHIPPRRVAEVVRLTDVMPTVLELLDLPAPSMDGVSLVRLMAGRAQLHLEAYAEAMYPQRFGWSPLRSLRDERFKLIDAPRPELYDLERDPFEQHNVYDVHPYVAEVMRQRIASFDAGGPPGVAAASAAGPSTELRERLSALGYVGSGPRRAPADGERRPDPKDCIGLYNARRSLAAPSAITEAARLCR
jgi:arylsulfatase A-like enzyme